MQTSHDRIHHGYGYPDPFPGGPSRPQLRQAKKPERLAWAYRRLSESVRFLARLEILTYDEQAMQRFEQLRKQKIRIGRTDLRIAAAVLEHGAALVTENTRDFKQVPGLKIVSWSGR